MVVHPGVGSFDLPPLADVGSDDGRAADPRSRMSRPSRHRDGRRAAVPSACAVARQAVPALPTAYRSTRVGLCRHSSQPGLRL